VWACGHMRKRLAQLSPRMFNSKLFETIILVRLPDTVHYVLHLLSSVECWAGGVPLPDPHAC